MKNPSLSVISIPLVVRVGSVKSYKQETLSAISAAAWSSIVYEFSETIHTSGSATIVCTVGIEFSVDAR